MKIEYFHASKYGNGVLVAEEFKKQMEAKGDAAGKPLPVQLTGAYGQAQGMRTAVPEEGQTAIGNEVRSPDHRGRASAGQKDRTHAHRDEEMAKWQRVIPVMTQIK